MPVGESVVEFLRLELRLGLGNSLNFHVFQVDQESLVIIHDKVSLGLSFGGLGLLNHLLHSNLRFLCGGCRLLGGGKDGVEGFSARSDNSNNLHEGRIGGDSLEPVHQLEVLLDPLIINECLENHHVSYGHTEVRYCDLISNQEVFLGFGEGSVDELEVISGSILGFLELGVGDLSESEDSADCLR